MPKTPLEWAALAALITAAVVVFGGALWLIRRKVNLPGEVKKEPEPEPPQPERPLPPPPPRRRTRPFNRTGPQIGDGVYRVEGNTLWISYGEPGATNRLRLEPGDTFLIWSDTLFTSDQDIRLTDWRPINRATQEGYIVRIAEVTESINEAIRAPMQQMQEQMAQMGREMSRMGQAMSQSFRQDMQQVQQDLQQLGRDGQWSVTTTLTSDGRTHRTVQRGNTPANPKAKVKTEEKRAPSRYDRLSDDSDDL